MNLIKEMTNQLTSFYVELLARFYRYKYVLPFNRLTLTRKKKKTQLAPFENDRSVHQLHHIKNRFIPTNVTSLLRALCIH